MTKFTVKPMICWFQLQLRNFERSPRIAENSNCQLPYCSFQKFDVSCLLQGKYARKHIAAQFCISFECGTTKARRRGNYRASQKKFETFHSFPSQLVLIKSSWISFSVNYIIFCSNYEIFSPISSASRLTQTWKCKSRFCSFVKHLQTKVSLESRFFSFRTKLHGRQAWLGLFLCGFFSLDDNKE